MHLEPLQVTQAAPARPAAPAAPATPAAPAAPAFPAVPGEPGRVVLPGEASAIDRYQGLRSQRRELARQLDWLEEKRGELTSQLEETSSSSPARPSLEQRLSVIDERIATIDKQMAQTEADLSKASAVPGATAEPFSIQTGREPQAPYIVGTVLGFCLLLPIVIAYSRRLWRRGAAAVTAIPKDLMAQLTRLEQAVEAIAVEVERNGEGQRFIYKILSENGVPALGAGAAEPIAVKQRQSVPEGRG